MTDLYGNTVVAGALANTALWSGQQVDHTVIFPKSGTITAALLKWAGSPGYSAGTGGTVQYFLETDDGSPQHLPSGTIIGQSAVQSAQFAEQYGAIPNVAFTSPIQVQAGQEYHLVIVNNDPNSDANYVSIDDLWDGGGSNVFSWPPMSPADQPRDPALSPNQFNVLFKDPGSAWGLRENYTAIGDFTYGDGSHFGNGYMEVSSTAAGGGLGHKVSGSQQVGEVFTVSAPTMTVNGLNVAVVRVSGSSPLTATLLSNGQVVATATESGIVSQGSNSWEGYNQQAASFNLSATLQQGQTYQLQLSASSDTVYSVHGLRDGSVPGAVSGRAPAVPFSPQTTFSDGYANYNTGSGWTDGWDTWGANPPTDKSQDLSFWFGSTPGDGGTVPPDQLSLIMSQSQGHGNAKFIVKLDGAQLGAERTITATNGKTQAFDFSGMWGSGAHAVEVDFDNPTKNKSMTVQQVTFDKTQYLSSPDVLTQQSPMLAISVGQ